MRLINIWSLQLEEFMDHNIPRYAILSHTWGEDEVTFQDMQDADSQKTLAKKGYTKIRRSCEQAREQFTTDYFTTNYIWVDTCCIDKTSSAELSEAINSMMRWYENSQICYAYLVDVPPLSNSGLDRSLFSKSRWFTRGWTLQELLAPKVLVFLAQDWSVLFLRESQSRLISEITGIEASFLQLRDKSTTLRASLSAVSIAGRMCWASKRETSRSEDRAYSLLGIFGINMPLLYGEGNGAFLRLQEEIIKHSDDQSLLAWNWDGLESCSIEFTDYPQDSEGSEGSEVGDLTDPQPPLWPVEDQVPASSFIEVRPGRLEIDEYFKHGHDPNPFHHIFLRGSCSREAIFANSPAAFSRCGDYFPCKIGESISPYFINNKGLSMEVPLLTTDICSFALIQCQRKRDPGSLLVIPLVRIQDNIYARVNSSLYLSNRHAWSEWPFTQIYLLPSLEFVNHALDLSDYTVILQKIPSNFHLKAVSSACSSSPASKIVMKGNATRAFSRVGAETFIWFRDMNDHSNLILFGFKLAIKESGEFNSENLYTTTQFLFHKSNKSESVKSMQQMRTNWAKLSESDVAFHNASEPYLARVTKDEFFGKFLFSIAIEPFHPREEIAREPSDSKISENPKYSTSTVNFSQSLRLVHASSNCA
ncbi:hypothetical protein N7456_000591 [Penicillium angulare]|uniref:Heterokaryon incompatibility n=1 Tax=Penicillium angulare TaxID=116970 RepID=A0A9W9GDS7_9EURO|nr:hypothetical protein N7456_000591 [Penicillium angulare]